MRWFRDVENTPPDGLRQDRILIQDLIQMNLRASFRRQWK